MPDILRIFDLMNELETTLTVEQIRWVYEDN